LPTVTERQSPQVVRVDAPRTRDRRNITLAVVLCAQLMIVLDMTVVNIALPSMATGLHLSATGLSWVLNAYTLTFGGLLLLGGRAGDVLGRRAMFMTGLSLFTLASLAGGLATSPGILLAARAVQGVGGAIATPAVLATIIASFPEGRERVRALGAFTAVAMGGASLGLVLGGVITQWVSWRWVFFINVPVGALAAAGILIFIRDTRRAHREAFDFFGFATLSLAIGALQMFLDRGELKDWFGSTEIWVEVTIAGLAFYLFIVHTATATDRSFLNRDLLKDANCAVGTVLMFLVAIPLFGTMVLLPTMLQDLLNYPVLTTGLVTMPRGIGTMAAMFLVARLIGCVDTRLIILAGLMLTAVALWQMTGFSLLMGMGPIISTGVLQGFGLGLVFTPLSIVTFSTLPRQILTQGTAIFSLTRNIGSSVGIAIVEALLVENTQIVHSRLVEQLRPDNPLARLPHMTAPFSLTDPSGIAALNAEATRQAAMVAYIDNFKLMMMIVIVGLPLLLLLRRPLPAPGAPVAAE
jgi:MFS transporter, DHA2 family, multidrug resistance protein